jgi:hypothetical protein
VRAQELNSEARAQKLIPEGDGSGRVRQGGRSWCLEVHTRSAPQGVYAYQHRAAS